MKITKVTTSAPAPKSVNKSAFVRALPEDLSATEVIAKAKAAGITVSKAQVYTIRTNARAQARKGGTRRPGRPSAAAQAAAPSAQAAQPASSTVVAAPAKAGNATRSVDGQFANLALDVGLARAEQLLQRLRQVVRETLAG